MQLICYREQLNQGHNVVGALQARNSEGDWSDDDNRRRYDAVSFIISTDMLKTNRDDLTKLSQHMESLVHEDSAKRFFKLVKARLTFSDMPDRFESIPAAYRSTFSWIFDQKKVPPNNHSWSDFAYWLSSSQVGGLYWITGKYFFIDLW